MADNIILYILIAIIPGLIWLFFFLRKDNLQEPKIEIIKVFYFAMMAVIPAGLVELYLIDKIQAIDTSSLYYLLKFILIVGLIEETIKYLVVRYLVLKKSFLDEPIDIVIYMIISGLGFATAENILVFLLDFTPQIQNCLYIGTIRFFGANLLHLLCSGIIGIFIALSFYHLKHRSWLIPLGFILGVLIHGVFNFSIELSIISSNEQATIIPFIITAIIMIPFIVGINKIRKMKSVCKIN